MSFKIVLEELEELFNQEKILVAFLGSGTLLKSNRLKLECVQDIKQSLQLVRFTKTPFLTKDMINCFYIGGLTPTNADTLKEWRHRSLKIAIEIFDDEEIEKLLILIRKIFILHKIEAMKNDQ